MPRIGKAARELLFFKRNHNLLKIKLLHTATIK